MIGILRECFRHVPCVGLSATLTPIGITKFCRLMHMANPEIIRETVRRHNLKVWVAKIQGQNYDDLRILIPDRISAAAEIPVTLVFVNSRVEATAMCEWLRTLLPTALQAESKEIVRTFHAPLNDESKDLTLEWLRCGRCRIATCTEAFGLGVNIAAIPRVVQWKLNANVGIDSLYQHVGRGGRDTRDPALALIFVSKVNMSTSDPTPKTKNSKIREATMNSESTNSQSASVTLTPLSINPERKMVKKKKVSVTHESNQFDFTLPVTPENMSLFQPFLPQIYSGPAGTNGNGKSKKIAKPSERRLVHTVKWTISTNGCRHRPPLVAFADAQVMFESSDPDCDNCLMGYLLANGGIEEPPVVYGIPFAITLAYEPYAKTENQADTTTQKARTIRKRTIAADRMEKLTADIHAWRDILEPLFTDRPGLDMGMLLSNKTIDSIAVKCRHIDSEDELKDVLRGLGHALPGSMLTPHVGSLHKCIMDSLSASHPPRQLETSLRNVSSQGPLHQPPSTCGPLSANRIQTNLQKPAQSSPQSVLTPGIQGLKSSQTTSAKHWPIPKPIIPSRQPLAELRPGDARLNVIRIAQPLIGTDVVNMSTATPPHGKAAGESFKVKLDIGRFRRENPMGAEEVFGPPKRRKVI